MNEKQLMLYFGIGKYISLNSRKGFWGKGAIDEISDQLNKELPGLRGFTSRNLRYMRTFYEEWEILDSEEISMITGDSDNSNLELTSSKMQMSIKRINWNLQIPKEKTFPYDAFFHIGFTHHRIILGGVKGFSERLFYIQSCAKEHYTVEELKKSMHRNKRAFSKWIKENKKMRKLASIQRIWKIEPIYCELISAALSMKVVSNKYMLKNE